MTEQAQDPILEKSVTITLTIGQINNILNTIASEVPFIKAVGIINEFQAQVGAQLAEEDKNEQ
jgi:hypothetical protein